MEEDLRDHLLTSTGLTDLIAERLEWSARPAHSPSVSAWLIDGPPDQTLKGPSGLVQARVQFDCWGTTFLQAKAVGDVLRAALPPFDTVVGATKFQSCIELDLERDRFGDVPNILHRTRIDFRVNYSPA